MIDIKQLTQQKNELKEVWDYLGIDSAFPDKQVRQWLLEHDKAQIEAAIMLIAKREHDVKDAVAYVGKVLHNSKIQNMTVEERQEKISSLSALAGRARAAKEYSERVATIKQEFASSLPENAELSLKSAEIPLYSAAIRSIRGENALGVGVGSGSGVDVGVDSGAEADAEKEKNAAAPLKEKKDQTNTNPSGAYGVSPNKTNQNPKPKTCKKCGVTLERNVNHTCAPVKTQDYDVAKAQGGYFPGDAGCQGCGKIRRNWNSDWCQGCWDTRQGKSRTASASNSLLGKVDEL